MRKNSIVGALSLLIAGLNASQAQIISDCDWEASAWNLVEPWAENSRTFSNGATRLAVLDTVEPAAGAMHILILSPPYDPLAGRQCKVLSWAEGIGFSGLNFSELQAGYDPSRGLLFELPVQIYDPETSFSNSAIVFFELNQATGVITTDIELGSE